MSKIDVLNPHNEKLISENNSLKNIIKTISVNEFLTFLRNHCYMWIFDLRSLEKFSKSHIINSKHANCTTNSMAKMSINQLKKEFSVAIKIPERIVMYNQNDQCYNSFLLKFFEKSFQFVPNILEGGFENFLKSAPNEFIECQTKIVHSPSNNDLISEDIMETKISEIEPNLFLGNANDSENLELLKSIGITHIVCVTSKSKLFYEEYFTYKRIEASDCGNQNLIQYFDESYQFIEQAKMNKGKILVHCLAGVSRSVTIVVAYLIRKYHLKTLKALDKVREKRPIASPNFNFLGQLDRYYQALNSQLLS